ncbi:hypothetical protein [Pseudorhodobacter sp.]|uniref:hypothetical protein n=1 Tax=Pseudorhodobacter sp. TaxID=1934400 RepID=UPI0026488ECF|nr:hypothetical protein [Pseudorhodobacter sp.]MDN5788846.1 hypothetical protein [Pseudorhodobacter sp.]
MNDTVIGGLAKPALQPHGASMAGQLKFRVQLARSRFRRFMADQPPSVVVMEACGSDHFRARVMINPGHGVKIAPQYLLPSRRRCRATDQERSTPFQGGVAGSPVRRSIAWGCRISPANKPAHVAFN